MGSPDAILICDEGFRLYCGNRAAEKLIGYTVCDWQNLDLPDLIDPLYLEKLKRLIQGGKPVTGIAFTFKTKNDHEFLADLRYDEIKHGDEALLIIYLQPEADSTGNFKYRDLIESIDDVIFTVDLQGRITYISPSIEAILGSKPEELKLNYFWDYIYPADVGRLKDRFVRLQKGEVEPSEYRLLTKKGEIKWVRSFSRGYKEDGRVIEIRGILTDITDMRRAREEQRKIFEQTVGLLAIANFDGYFTRINPTWTTVLGYSQREMLSRPFMDFVHPDDIESTKAAMATLTDDKPLIGFTNRYRCADGSYRWIEWSSVADVADGICYAMATDQTNRIKAEQALRESENMYRSLVESANMGICLIGTDHKIKSLNTKLKQWFPELTESGDAIFASLRDRIDQKHEPGESPLELVLSDGRQHEQVLSINNEGKRQHYRIVASPVFDENDKINGVIETVEDVSEWMRMEDELTKREKLESIGVLAGGIAHDFNNILVAILGNISLAKMELDQDSEMYDILNDAELASERARDLTHQLLTFSKGGEPIKRRFDITRLIREASSFALRGSNVRCQYNIADNLLQVYADQGQMSQVINNISLNAVQSMPRGGTMYVSAENVSVDRDFDPALKPGNYVMVGIRDEGVGIPEENLKKIFDPFFTTKDKSNGLGLSSSYSVIKKHDGHIRIASRPEEGSRFDIFIKASDKQDDNSRNPVCGSNNRDSKCVLVVDDEPSVLKLAEISLQRMGYNPDTASNGKDGIDKFKKAIDSGRPYDYVILDLTIPGGMGGKDIIKELLQLDPGVKALVSSGYSNDPVMAEYRDYGFKGRIVKPYRISDLLDALKKLESV